MKLKFQLILRIAVIGFVLLVATTAYVLESVHAQTKQHTETLAHTLAQQLSLQLLRIQAGFEDANAFPNFDLWRSYQAYPGICIRFFTANGLIKRTICQGEALISQVPPLFSQIYQALFKPGLTLKQAIIVNKKQYGYFTLTPSDVQEITVAYTTTCQLLTLSLLTVLAISVWFFFSVQRLLMPAHVIVNTLRQMQQGDLTPRLPKFTVPEWQQTASAINQLAENQQHLLQQYNALGLKLLHIQEQERTRIAHELHDEFGQCLAGINALATSIIQTSLVTQPELADEAKQITAISLHIMTHLRTLLIQLRPAELEQFGLAACLKQLIAHWARISQGKTIYQLTLSGNIDELPEPLPIILFRIIQECLTNTAKHANASVSNTELTVYADTILLTIKDNGSAQSLPLPVNGLGLKGVQEKVQLIGGELFLSLAEPSGLIIDIRLPLENSNA